MNLPDDEIGNLTWLASIIDMYVHVETTIVDTGGHVTSHQASHTWIGIELKWIPYGICFFEERLRGVIRHSRLGTSPSSSFQNE